MLREGLRDIIDSNLRASKLAPRFIGPFKVLKAIGDSYNLEIPSSLWLNPTFYAGLLKIYSWDTLHGLVQIPEPGALGSASFPPCLASP